MPLARNGSSVSTFSSPTGPCLRAISAMRASSSTRSRADSRLIVKANFAPSGRPCRIALSGNRTPEDDDDGMFADEHVQIATHEHHRCHDNDAEHEPNARHDIHGNSN